MEGGFGVAIGGAGGVAGGGAGGGDGGGDGGGAGDGDGGGAVAPAPRPVPPTKVRFNENDDVILMKEVIASRPYAAGYGKVMAAWDALASKVVAQAEAKVTNFRPRHVDGKACQSRFKTLLDKHKKFNALSERKSGSSEEETELVTLLDDINADYHDFIEAANEAKDAKASVERGKEVYDVI